MRYTLLLVFFLGLLSCDSSKPSVGTEDSASKKSEQLAESPVCLDITKLRNVEDTNALAKTNILDFQMNEGCVCITYQYSGCNVGEPMIVWDGTVIQNTRPTVRMDVYIKEAGMCDQLLKATTCFSMIEMESVGTQVLIYLNDTKKNYLINYQKDPLSID